jgi:mono/diheme cytochrome c family protein
MRRFANAPELLKAADSLFPDMSTAERLSLRWIVLPLAKSRLADLKDLDRPLPFPNGTPGSTNGVAALKYALRAPLAGGGKFDAGVVSIPDLSDRVWKTSFLADGAYGIAGKAGQSVTTPESINEAHLSSLAAITTFFTVPSMGVSPDKAKAGLSDATAIMAFLTDFRSQRFPGSIDQNKVARGAQLYQVNCSSCHGTYDQNTQRPSLIRYPNWIGNVGTDGLRGQTFNQALVDGIKKTPYAEVMSINIGRGYVAPPLGGIWASSPYLHNGSVPSLRALLEPDARHAKFKTGGHALDFETVGIKLQSNGDYAQGYKPFSTPVWIDTNQLGRANSGHIYGSTLSEPDKAALIEYLKKL